MASAANENIGAWQQLQQLQAELSRDEYIIIIFRLGKSKSSAGSANGRNTGNVNTISQTGQRDGRWMHNGRRWMSNDSRGTDGAQWDRQTDRRMDELVSLLN